MSNRFYKIENISFKEDHLTIIINGTKHIFSISAISEKLAKASNVERSNYQISPSGYGIHWHLLDEDLSIDGLLGKIHIPRYAKQTANT